MCVVTLVTLKCVDRKELLKVTEIDGVSFVPSYSLHRNGKKCEAEISGSFYSRPGVIW